MRRIATLALTALAAMAFSAIASSSAFAETLPEFETQTNFTGTSGASKLNLTGAGIKCTAASTTATASNKTHATGKVTYTGCLLGAEPCWSLGLTAGSTTIVAEVLMLLVRLKSGDAGIFFEVDVPVHIECKFAATLVIIQAEELGEASKHERGVLGLITPILTATKEYTVNLNVVTAKQEIETYLNDAGATITPKFEGSINGGAFKAATLEQASNKVTTASTTKIIKTT